MKLAVSGKFVPLGELVECGSLDLMLNRSPSRRRSRASAKLSNYLRTHRKRAGFSQEEIAFLLGWRCGGQVSRYERFVRCPNLETAFAFEAIFSAPARELFKGIHQGITRRIARRARLSNRRLGRVEAGPQRHRKLAVLQRICASPASR